LLEYKILKDSERIQQFYGNIFAKMNKIDESRTAAAK
jgi:hypothetical protein